MSGAKLGFIALTDSSPLIIAREKGMFAKHGVPDVEVSKQASWGATRDNLVLGSDGGGFCTDPAALVDAMPPTVQYSPLDGSTGKRRAWTRAAPGRNMPSRAMA